MWCASAAGLSIRAVSCERFGKAFGAATPAGSLGNRRTLCGVFLITPACLGLRMIIGPLAGRVYCYVPSPEKALFQLTQCLDVPYLELPILGQTKWLILPMSITKGRL